MLRKMICLFCIAMLLSACGAKIERDPNEVQSIPEEEVSLLTQTETTVATQDGRIGYIQKVALPIHERGTHVLLSGTGESANLVALLESMSLDLNAYEDQQVEVKGKLEQLSDAGLLLMQVSEVISITEKQQSDVLEELRRLARSYETPYNFTPDDKYQVISHSEQAGTMSVKVIQTLAEKTKAYLVKMLRRGEVATGTWEIYEIKETEYVPQILEDEELEAGASLVEDPEQVEGEAVETELEGETNLEDDTELSFGEEITDQAEKVIKVIEADETVSDEDFTIITQIENELEGLLGIGTITNISRIDIIEVKYAYAYFENDGENKLALLSLSESGLSKLALFVEGEDTDWEKVEGENVAKASAATVYKKGEAGWEKKGELKDSWRFFENSAYQLQVPYFWYYKLRGANVDFSDTPVSDGNMLLSVDLIDSYESALAQNGYTDEENLQVGDLNGVERHYETGAVKAILQNAEGQAVVVTVKSAAKHILSDVLSVLKLK